MLQTMTVTGTLGESYDLEGDWLCSSGLAQHRLTKHPENKQQNCESFIWGEEGEPMAWHEVGRCVTCATCPLCLTGLFAKARGRAVLFHIPPEWCYISVALHLGCSRLLLPVPRTSPVCLAFLPHISSAAMTSLKEICRGLPLYPLPENRGRRKGIPHAPVRTPNLTGQEKKVTWAFPGPHFSSFQINAAQGSRPDCLKCFSECSPNFVANVFPWCYNFSG